MQTTAHATVEALQNAKRFPLTFKNAAEDIPRLITCYGRCCGGELALVLRPDEGRGAFVKVQKDKAVAAWWGAEGGSDALKEPEIELAPKDAVKRIKVEQMAVPRVGAITLKGQWKGHLTCQPSGHQVVLQRKIASYGNLFIMSSEGRWTWKVIRTEKWFTHGHEKWGGSRSTLKLAIQAGLADAMNLLGEACSVRDSHRRAALDSEYAEGHPLQPAKEGKDPIERLKEPVEKVAKARRKNGETALSLVPAPVASPLSLPAPPARLDDLREAAGALSEEASAYTRLKASGWPQSYTATADLWYGALLEARLDEVVTRIQDWFDSPAIKPAELLDELHAQVEERDLTPTDRERAVEALEQLERELKRGPALLTRARWLIRYAANAVSSRLCQGRDREEASAAIEQAAAEYEAIRQAIEAEQGEGDALQEEDPRFSLEMSKRLRALGKGLALTAAKLARSCATGQQTVTALLEGPVRKNNPPKAGDNACACKVGEKARPAEVEKAKASRGDLVIVPLYRDAKTVEELSDWLRPNTNAYLRTPTLKEAKKWLDRAAVLVGLKGFEIEKAPHRPQPPARFSLLLTHPRFGEDPGVSRQACLVLEASLALVDLHVVAHGPNRHTAAGSLGCREWLGENAGQKPAAPAPTDPGQEPPPKAPTKRGQAPKKQRPPPNPQAAEPAESGGDANKDAILMDAITSAIQSALGNGGH